MNERLRRLHDRDIMAALHLDGERLWAGRLERPIRTLRHKSDRTRY
jgi:hypothetical protein